MREGEISTMHTVGEFTYKLFLNYLEEIHSDEAGVKGKWVWSWQGGVDVPPPGLLGQEQRRRQLNPVT